MKTIATTYYPNVRSTLARPRVVELELVRMTATLVIAKSPGGVREVRISRKTAREVGVDRFASHYGFSTEQLNALAE